MRKRVSLARTLIYRPETLLLDEPFGALDAQTRVLMQKQLLDLYREFELTVLLVTHDIGEAIALADRIVLLSARPGRLVEVLDVPHPESRDVFRRERGNEDLYAHIWDHLAAQAAETGGDLMRWDRQSLRRDGRSSPPRRRSCWRSVLGWEFAPNWMLEDLLWSRPSAIFRQTVIWLADGTLLRHALATLRHGRRRHGHRRRHRHRGRALCGRLAQRSRG